MVVIKLISDFSLIFKRQKNQQRLVQPSKRLDKLFADPQKTLFNWSKLDSMCKISGVPH